MTRSELREKIMVILYQIEIYKNNNLNYEIDDVISENVEIENDFIKEVVYGVVTHLDEINSLANSLMKEWTIDRLDKSGAAILRIGIYELKYTDTPQIVVINEAIELSKKYCDEKISKLINAVLDRMINE